jgi:hypothetical protein
MKSKSTELKSSIKPERRIVMKKPYGVVTLIAVLTGAILLQQTIKVPAAPPPTGIKNVVLVHGAFADGSGWEAVANILKKSHRGRGYHNRSGPHHDANAGKLR